MINDFKWSQRVLDFCVKHGFEAGKILMREGLPYAEIVCSEEIPNRDALTVELKSLLPEGSKILFKVDIRNSTVHEVSRELEATRMPWTLDVKNHAINIKTMIPKLHPVWDKIMEVISKDIYVKELKVKILDPDTIRESMVQGKGPKEAENIAAESAEEFNRTNVSLKLKEEITKNVVSGRRLQQDDVTDLKILLNTCNTVEDFLKSI